MVLIFWNSARTVDSRERLARHINRELQAEADCEFAAAGQGHLAGIRLLESSAAWVQGRTLPNT